MQVCTEHPRYAKHLGGKAKAALVALKVRASPTNEPVIASVHDAVEKSEVAWASKLPHLAGVEGEMDD